MTQIPQSPLSLGNEPDRAYRIVRGRVRCHFKDIGLYLVSPMETGAASTGMRRAVDLSSCVPWGRGVAVEAGAFSVGTVVLMLVDGQFTWDTATRPTGLMVILGADNAGGKPTTEMHPTWMMASPLDMDSPDFLAGPTDPVRRAIREAGNLPRLGDHAAGRPLDVCDGDWVAHNPLKGYLAVTNDRVSMAAGPMSGLHMFPVDDSVILNTGTRFLSDGMASRKAVYPDGDGYTLVDHMAASAGGSLGALGDPADLFTGPPHAADKDALPVWRHQLLQGRLVNGRLEAIIVPVEEGGINKGEARQRAVAGDYTGYDGVRVSSAAHSATLERSPAISTVTQRTDEFTRAEPLAEPAEVADDPFSVLDGADLELATQYADLMHQLMRRKFIERHLARAGARTEDWDSATADDICGRVLGAAPGDPPLKPLDADAPCYKITGEDLVEAPDPLGGTTVRSAMSPSYVHLSPTGAVVIGDSHGAEIRLEGGNLTITCPGDLKLLPGRDLVSLIPRDLSLFAQGRADLASDKGEVAIKGARGAVLAATAGPVAIEGTSPVPSTAETVEDRKDGSASGVVIRSATTLAMVGANVRLGLQAGDDTATGGRGDTAGILVLDAGKGQAVLAGDAVHVAGASHASLTTGDAGVSVTGALLGLGGQAVAIAAAKVGVGGERLVLTRPTIGPDGVKETRISAGGAMASVSVSGSVTASRSLAGQYVQAQYVRATTMGANNGSVWSGIKATGAVAPLWTTDGKGIEAGDVSAHRDQSGRGMQAIAGTMGKDALFSAAGTLAAGLYYPTSDECHCGADYFLVPARWQRKLGEGGGRRKWSPVPVKHPLSGDEGLPKPGMEALTGGSMVLDVSIDGGSVKTGRSSFSDGYPVNTDPPK